MKRKLLLTANIVLSAYFSNAQVTQINNNNSLSVKAAISSTKAIVVSEIDSSIWITDASLPGTTQISATIKYEDFGFVLSGKFIFRGSTPSTGSEIYISDGTAAGTVLVKDIYPGASSSAPADFTVFNGFIYFSAKTAAEGRELWRTDGTNAGTTLVKDIVPGTDSSNREDQYHLTSTGTYMLFAANSASTGVELWKSDGTNAGTVLLKDINTGNAGADSSNPANFYNLNNTILFTATDATHGEEIWKTDGTSGGTVLVKDINPGSGSCTAVEIFPGFSFPVFFGFHTFNNHAYFQANDGTSTGGLWSTDGTTANTILLKDIVSGTSLSFVFVIDAVNFSNKFIFPVSDGIGGSRSELWESDGTSGGTVLFKSFSPVNSGDIPQIFVPYNADYSSGTFSQSLFQGSKFFFTARTPAQGIELWISDGNLAGTSLVKDINPGVGDGIDSTGGVSYLYTTNQLFFSANDGTHGNELWKTDGTGAGTSLVFDINPNAPDADPTLTGIFNSKIIFSATDGDNPDARDLFVVDGTFSPLPVRLTNFTVSLEGTDGLLQWNTTQELNTKNFTIQRSYDGQNFVNIGVVQATGTFSNGHAYSFADAGIANSSKTIIYYRLFITDIDGKSESTNVISLKLRGNSKWNVQLLSNPVQDNISLLLSGVTGKLQVYIRSINGSLLYTKSMENVNGQISLPALLQKGVYILQAENNDERKIIKFIK
jgi:ELWxxDGT repeat protein